MRKICPIFDAHLDLAWNAVSYNRDLTQRVDEIRRREQGMTDGPGRGRGTLTLPEMKRSGVRVCVATLISRAGPNQPFKEGFKRIDLDYSSPSMAYAAARGQLAYYELLEQQGHIRILRSSTALNQHWENPQDRLGVILSMEGTDPIVTPAQAKHWFDLGLRAAGLTHYGIGRHGYGTAVEGPLSEDGIALLKEFEKLGVILDVTHLSDQSMAEAFDLFTGRLYASHHNCRALVNDQRQLTDDQIKTIIARGGVIGFALDAWMIYPGWRRGKTQSDVVGLESLVDHIDHICQLVGSTEHSGIGSDLDGGYGTEQTPRDLNTYFDLQRIGGILANRRYSDADIDAIFYGNFVRFFSEALPAKDPT